MFNLKKRYYFRHETPLSFHNFLRFFVLPGTFCYGFLILRDLDTFHKMYPRTSLLVLLIGASIALIPMALCLTAFIGSFKFRKYSFVCIHILYWGSFLYCLLFSEAPSAIAALFWAVIVTVYYHKRKPLFFPELIPDELILPEDDEDEDTNGQIRIAYESDPLTDIPQKVKEASPMKKNFTNVLFILWLALVPAVFVALALLTRLNPYVLVGIMFASNAVGVNLSRAEKQSPYERAMMYNSESFKSGLLITSFCIYAAFIACLFVDWQIALIGFAGALLLAGFVAPLFHWVIVIPMYFLLVKLMEFGRK